MESAAKRWFTGLAALALLGAGYGLGVLHSTGGVKSPAETAASQTSLPGAPVSSPSPRTFSVAPPTIDLSAIPAEERERRNETAKELTRVFDLEMVTFFKQVLAKSQGEKIEWRGCISASSSLSKAERECHKDLWDKYLALCKKYQDLVVPYAVRLRFYRLFFDEASFQPTAEQLAVLPQADEWDSVPFGYITEVINPAWFFEYVPIRTTCDFNTEKAQRDLPPHLRSLKAAGGNIPPTTGVYHLEGYNKLRADTMGGDTLRAIAKHTDLKGKDWADLGAGCGFTLPLFRQAIGPRAKLWAGDLDVYTLDVLKYTSRGTGTVVFQNYQDDCNCGENAFDIINMTGVHMGIMCAPQAQSNIENHFLPWIRSMNKALRPGGLLVVHDGNWDLVDRQVDRLVEQAGFKKIDQVECKEHSAFIWIFRVQK